VKLPATIFRQYDIRGIVGDQVTAATAHAIGQAFATMAWERLDGNHAPRLAVGRDNRPSGAELAAAVRARGWPVVYVKVGRRADNLDDVHAKTFRATRALPESVTHAAQGTWGAEIVAELTPEPNDFVVEKKGASGFGFTPLHRLLRNLGIRRCLVTGGATTGCVRATVFDGLALGYDVTVIADATYPPDSAHLDVLARWCSVRPTAEVLQEVSSTGQTR